jgi:hypothetical protein
VGLSFLISSLPKSLAEHVANFPNSKRDSSRDSTPARSWDWPAIHASPDGLHDLLANGLPGPVAGYVRHGA